MTKIIKAVLFDMDGVLIEARDWHYDALNRALELFGMPISRFDHLINFDGLPTRQKLKMLTIERGLPEQLHEFINEMKQIYTMETVVAQCKPVFTLEYALSSLKADGYHLAVCSNSIRNTIITMMDKSGLLPYIDYIVSNEDVRSGKPDPEMYINAINYFDLVPEQCLVVEDNDNGIAAAKAAGAHLLVVQDPSETNLDNIVQRISSIEKRSSTD